MLAIPTLAHSAAAASPRAEPDPGEHAAAEDAVTVARRWELLGFQRLYLRALVESESVGQTADLVRELTRQNCLPIQLESASAEDSDAESMLDLGVDLAVSAGRGLADIGWLESLAAHYPARVSLVVDLRAGRLLPRGREPRRDLFDLVDELAALQLGALIVGVTHNAARLQAAELTRLEELAARAAWPLVVLGAPASLIELRNLEERGVSAVVLPLRWDHDALDPRLIAEEFASAD